MGMLVSEADIDHIRSLYPLLEIRALTSQQERFIGLILKGYSTAAAERAVGYAPGHGRHLMNEPHIQAICEYFREYHLREIKVSREMLTNMLLDSHARAANATEEILAAREIGKLHDLYESDKHKGVKINNNINNINANGAPRTVTNVKQVEKLDDTQLLELAGYTSLDPVPLPKSDRAPVTIDQTPVIVDQDGEAA